MLWGRWFMACCLPVMLVIGVALRHAPPVPLPLAPAVTLPSSLLDAVLLRSLQLSGNSFSGTIPEGPGYPTHHPGWSHHQLLTYISMAVTGVSGAFPESLTVRVQSKSGISGWHRRYACSACVLVRVSWHHACQGWLTWASFHASLDQFTPALAMPIIRVSTVPLAGGCRAMVSTVALQRLPGLFPGFFGAFNALTALHHSPSCGSMACHTNHDSPLHRMTIAEGTAPAPRGGR